MTNKDQAGTAPGADAPHWTSRWRASYRRGDWMLLSGPTSMVVMQPAAPQWSDLINAVWEDVLGSASLADLVKRLAEFRLDGMPDFAALFWERDQMRSLVRGRVRLVDPSTGRVIAAGDGVQTWSEVGLGDLDQVEVHAGDQLEGEQLELPLVIGAVGASRVLLDSSDEMQISSPQGTFVGNAGALNRLEGDRLEGESAAAPAEASTGSVASAPAGGAVVPPPPPPTPAPAAAADRTESESGPGAGRHAHAADEDSADRGETLVDQPPVRPESSHPDAGRPDAGRHDGGRPDVGPSSGGQESGGRPDADRASTSGPQHASPGVAAGVAGAALGAGAAGVAASGATASGAGAAGASAAGVGAAGSPAAGAGAAGGPASAAPAWGGPSGAGPGSSEQSARPAEPYRPSPSRSQDRSDDDEGHTMVADGLPGLAGQSGQSGEPPKRAVLGVLHPSSGGTVDVDRPVVIGRAPAASRVPSDQLPRLLTVPSPSHDISRTHVQIAPENGRLVVTDLNSTNGTILVTPDGRRSDLRPGVGVPVDFGSVVDLGDGITIAVDRD